MDKNGLWSFKTKTVLHMMKYGRTSSNSTDIWQTVQSSSLCSIINIKI